MNRKDYLKPSMLMVTMVQSTCLLTGSGDPKKADTALEDYNRKNEVDW